MSDDVIKRSDAIEALGEEPYVWTDDDEFAQGERSQWIDDVSALKAVPSADRPQEWIPCSERLPNEYKTVLITFEYKGKPYTTTGFRRTKNAVTYWDSKDQFRYRPLNVLAWMPLPEPWKGAV